MASVSTVEKSTITTDRIASGDDEQLVTMVVDNQLFGIPILQVRDIVEATKITPVPLAPSAIAGVLNLRGRVVTVIDLRKLLGNFEELPWEGQMGVTVEYQGDLYTLLVDEIGDVRTLSRRDFDSAPSTLEENVRQLCSGIYRLRNNLLVVLDVSRILISEVIEATPMITVAERRRKKDAATANTDKQENKKRALSTLMADLRSSDIEGDGDGDGETSASDDIKERKKANRSRKPITERWQTVLDERARHAGQVVYRMNEPDDETVETALEEKASEDAKWDAELQARQAEEESTSPPAVSDEPPVYDPYGKREHDTATPKTPENLADSGKDAIVEEPAPEVMNEPPALKIIPDEPEATATPDIPEIPSDAPDAPEIIPDVPEATATPDILEIPSDAPDAPEIIPDVPEATATPDIPEIPSDAPDAPEIIPDVPEATATPDIPEIPSDAPAMPEPIADAPSPDDSQDTGSVVGGWWNKLRGKTEDTPAGEATGDTPKADGKSARSKAKLSKKAKSKAKSRSKSKSDSKSGKK